ncbi:MAG TPA: HAD family hydrolase, partial [Thermoanaerobaculia bacterium]|nr:HAD family hydrolase [Thermoanaerobaculia bacterium]
SLADVDLASVKKRLKEKSFARGVHREDVYNGTEEIGLPLDEHIENVIQALRAAAGELGL